MFSCEMTNNANVIRFIQPVNILSLATLDSGIKKSISTVVNRSLIKGESMGSSPDGWKLFVGKVKSEVKDQSAVILITAVPSVACQMFISGSQKDGVIVTTFVSVSPCFNEIKKEFISTEKFLLVLVSW